MGGLLRLAREHGKRRRWPDLQSKAAGPERFTNGRPHGYLPDGLAADFSFGVVGGVSLALCA
jgi:hypothetical protein